MEENKLIQQVIEFKSENTNIISTEETKYNINREKKYKSSKEKHNIS